MHLSKEEPPKARLEMTPMLDVVFLLLVFFIYTFLTMAVQRGIHVDLPKADGTVAKGHQIQLTVTPDDAILLDGKTPMNREAAVAAVALRVRTLDVPVVIHADRKAHAGIALELLAALRAKGVTKVTFRVDKES